MCITAIYKFDPFLGGGYDLITETMDATWYKGNTPEEAVNAFLDSKDIRGIDVTIIEEI